jgi:hypothetical protein
MTSPVLVLLVALWSGDVSPAQFIPLSPLPVAKVLRASEAFPGGRYEAANLFDGRVQEFGGEYASHGKGLATAVDVDLGHAVPVAGFQHVDRNDLATVAAAELIFSNEADFARPVATVKVKHVNQRAGVTFAAFAPVTARYVRWKVTAAGRHGCLGGKEITFYAAGPREKQPSRVALRLAGVPTVLATSAGRVQPVRVTIDSPYTQSADAMLEVSGAKPRPVTLRFGQQQVEVPLPAADRPRPIEATFKLGGHSIATARMSLKPVRDWVVYLLPHSHVDIGYTHVQAEVERKQWQYLEQGIEAARATARAPAGEQFKWNVEVLWAVDSYLKQATPQQAAAFVDAVRRGWVGLDALYGSELTGLCRPEELVRLVDCAARLRRRFGFTIDSAMITDVPGYTWGLTSVLAAAGVKYWSIGPNGSDRIGSTLEAWADRPFYWQTPCGRQKILCWIPAKGYWRTFEPGPKIFERLMDLEAADYPYDVVQARYCLGDNAGPAVELSEQVRQWNAEHVVPRLAIATTSEMMRQLERRWADKIPVVRGDFTPYWEDGAASSAQETALNRASAERLSQAEALWAMLRPQKYPDADFCAAWRNVVLYDEHTWGAHNSISQPDSPFARSQWAVKQAFALDADRQSRALLERVADAPAAGKPLGAMMVCNTCSWPRTDLVMLPAGTARAGDDVRSSDGRPVPAQRLADGSLAFLAREVPALGGLRFTLHPGKASTTGAAQARATILQTPKLHVAVDEKTGEIVSVQREGVTGDFTQSRDGRGLNGYLYVPGKDPAAAVRSGPARVSIRERGPLVVSLVAESDAPGCRRLTREVRLVDGLDRVEIVNTIDKQKVRTKEGVHLAFPFCVPGGTMHVDLAWAVIRPELDQMPGACKNWFTVQRWIDVSRDDRGITWATIDAPMVELGAITAETPWLGKIEPGQTVYSYVMNNYWHTNYKADQEGPTVFRYALRPHAGPYRPIEAARFGAEASQPLVVLPAGDGPAAIASRLSVAPDDVIVATLRPSSDGRALIVRLFGAGAKASKATLRWSSPSPKAVWLSDLSESPLARLAGPIDVPAFGLVTLRAELP